MTNDKIDWNSVPLLYAYIFQYIVNKIIGDRIFNQEVNSRVILQIWHRHIYHIPKIYDYHILKELEGYNLIEKTGNSRYVIKSLVTDKLVKRLTKGSAATKGGPPYLYLFIFMKMKEVFGCKNIISSYVQLISIWRKHIPNISRIYDPLILEEMCNYGFLRKINSQKYIFNGAGFNDRKLKNIFPWYPLFN